MLGDECMRVRLSLLAVLLLSICGTALPEIEKVGRVCADGVCPAWWPKLDPVKGWHHDDGASLAHGVNMQVPDGSKFSDAETVIYAKALYKPRNPEANLLEVLIKNDREEFLKEDSSIEIANVAPLKTKNGKTLEARRFFVPM